MAIKDFITHSFVKSSEGKTKLSLRDSVVPVDDALEAFVSELKHSFHRRAGREYGYFAETDPSPVLPTKLSALISEEINFVAMSVQWMYALQDVINELDLDAQGHIVFLREEHLGEELFYIFVVSYKESLYINKKLEIEQTRHIDFGTTLMAAKVDVSVWQANASRSYLTLAVPRSSNLWIDTFRVMTGYENAVDKKAETENFLQSVATFSMDIPDDSVSEFQSQIVDYCLDQDKAGQPVGFADLSESVSQVPGVDSGKLAKALTKGTQAEDDKLHVDRNSLRRFLRFTGREKDLTVSFSSTVIPERVQYDSSNDVLTIKGLPKTLRDQLVEHLKG